MRPLGWRWLEFCGLYLAIPGLIYLYREDASQYALLIMLLVAALLFALLLGQKDFDRDSLLRRDGLKLWLRRILRFFAINAAILALYTWHYHPDVFLGLPEKRPLHWFAILFLYPVLSAYPQEIIYRAWLFHRYRDLVHHQGLLIVLSAAAFGFAHLFFGNWIAIFLSVAGGFVFASTYLRSRSLLIVAIEHGLWGDFLFTVGLGMFLFTGNIE
ncbi:MAG: CPBP family intramembrane metalloprotease [Gammaproteobacteria bacterium]|nr:MAG: CPBP family intramembrane metalloprotease [Gammaproteobacteria bacterium]